MSTTNAASFYNTMGSNHSAKNSSNIQMDSTKSMKDGVEIPEFLSPFLGGTTFLPYPNTASGEQNNSTTPTTFHITTNNNTACPDEDDSEDCSHYEQEEIKQQLSLEMKGVDDDMALLRQQTLELDEAVRKLSQYYITLEKLKEKIKLLELKKVVLVTSKDSLEGIIDVKLRRAEGLRDKILAGAISNNSAQDEVDYGDKHDGWFIARRESRRGSKDGGPLDADEIVAQNNTTEASCSMRKIDLASDEQQPLAAIAISEKGMGSSADVSIKAERFEVAYVSTPQHVEMVANACAGNISEVDDGPPVTNEKEMELPNKSDDPLPAPDLDLYNFQESSPSSENTSSSVLSALVGKEVSFCLKIGDLGVENLNDAGMHVELNRDINCTLLCAILSILAERGMKHTHLDDRKVWKPSKDTGQFMRKNKRAALGSEILVWSGHPFDFSSCKKMNNFEEKMYGTDLTVVRACGVVQVKPKCLLELLLDNDRVKTYNKMSLGRSNELVLQAGVDTAGPFGVGHIIVAKSLSKPPLVRKPIQFISMMHARTLDPKKGEGKGYLIVTRGVEECSSFSKSKSLGNQILFSFNLLREIKAEANDDDSAWTEMTTISHVNIANAPSFLATSVGMKSAKNFIADVRKACAGVS